MWTSASENVQRVLSDLKPNPSFWCKLGFHKWERWKLFKFADHKGALSYKQERIYERECQHCGLNQFKKQASPRLNLM